MSLHNFKRTYQIPVAAVAAGADATVPVVKAPFDGTVSASFVPNALITGADTNTRRHRLVNKGSGGAGSAVAAELQYNNGINAAANDEKTITASATAADLAVVEGDIIAFQSTHIGTGLADPGGLLIVVVTRDNG